MKKFSTTANTAITAKEFNNAVFAVPAVVNGMLVKS
jgi:hypothetical protein